MMEIYSKATLLTSDTNHPTRYPFLQGSIIFSECEDIVMEFRSIRWHKCKLKG